MPLFGKMSIPTGYESEQARILLKRKLAEALLSRGLSPQGGMRSPLEALGSMAQVFAGKRMESKADKLEGGLTQKMLGDYQAEHDAFQADVASGMSPADLVKKWSGARHPFIADEIKPYADAYGEALKNREGIVEGGGGFVRKGDYMEGTPGKPARALPNDPNKPVWTQRGPNGELLASPNPAYALSRAMGQPGAIDFSKGVPNFFAVPGSGPAAAPTPGLPPSAPAMGASTSLAPSAGAAPNAAAPNIDLSLLNPMERQVIEREIARRKGITPEARNLPLGNPLKPPPSGIANGKPYWMVNGVPYDNPEGR